MHNDNVINKQGLLIFGGEASDDYGMVVAEAPVFDRPIRKQNVFNVPGRNGAIILPQDAFEDTARSYNVWLTKEAGTDLAAAVDAVSAWLMSKTGYQRLEDSFEPDVFRLAYFSGAPTFTNKLMQYGETTLTFTCRPERFLKAGEQSVDVTSPLTIYNPTRFNAKPLIHIEGSGTVNIAISGRVMTANVVDYINIDCDALNAYREPYENKNSEIAGTFAELVPGDNTINITGATLATLTPRYFTI